MLLAIASIALMLLLRLVTLLSAIVVVGIHSFLGEMLVKLTQRATLFNFTQQRQVGLSLYTSTFLSPLLC